MYKAIRDSVIVETPEVVTKVGSLFIPDTAHRDAPMEGKVIVTGPLCSDVEVGDVVYFRKHTGTELKERTFHMEECEILGVKVDG